MTFMAPKTPSPRNAATQIIDHTNVFVYRTSFPFSARFLGEDCGDLRRRGTQESPFFACQVFWLGAARSSCRSFLASAVYACIKSLVSGQGYCYNTTMLDIKFIRENPEKVKEAARNKRAKVDIDAALMLDTEHREVLQKLEVLRAQQNKKSKEAQGGSEELKKLKADIQGLEKQEVKLKAELERMLLLVPNIPLEMVPVGKDESEKVVVREVGKNPQFNFTPKDYLTIAGKLDIIDMERASKVSGSRFGYVKREAALLEFALVQYTFRVLGDALILKKIIENNSTLAGIEPTPFIPVVPPVMIKPDVMRKMARLEPVEERYHIPADDLYLVGSAEHTLGSMHMDETFAEKDLPRRYIGFSTAFRREAGSYGKDTKGILRVHQFDKLEVESFCLPELSRKEHEFIVACHNK